MRIKAKLCDQLSNDAKLQLSRPVAVYVNSFSNQNLTDKESENYLGDAMLFNGPEGLCFEMDVSTQRSAGHKLFQEMHDANLGCASFFVVSEPGLNGYPGSRKKVIFEDLPRVLGDSSHPSIEPVMIVLTSDSPNPGSEVKKIY
ncbi:MAG: hypothetical protein ABSA16_12270 [Thermoguttaceae bacterium]|jgi:hypothetical protein